jgi:hypothetical protein
MRLPWGEFTGHVVTISIGTAVSLGTGLLVAALGEPYFFGGSWWWLLLLLPGTIVGDRIADLGRPKMFGGGASGTILAGLTLVFALTVTVYAAPVYQSLAGRPAEAVVVSAREHGWGWLSPGPEVRVRDATSGRDLGVLRTWGDDPAPPAGERTAVVVDPKGWFPAERATEAHLHWLVALVFGLGVPAMIVITAARRCRH